MKLKTLKDLEKDFEWKYDTYVGLRQEAIKHYKHIDKEMNTEGSLADVKHCDCSAEWIKYFFNITEKDL